MINFMAMRAAFARRKELIYFHKHLSLLIQLVEKHLPQHPIAIVINSFAEVHGFRHVLEDYILHNDGIE